ncbi:MAG: Gfo/Idh/MocA family oxidoreductase [Planctomycetota bacterium]
MNERPPRHDIGPARALRIGIIGARRARQGLGPFVAKWLACHGARVVAHAGTSLTTVAEATADLARVAGVDARGYVGAASMLAAEALDAVAILSPPEHHGAALDACLAAGVHVLCEKPLLAPDVAAPSQAARVRALEDGFAERGRVLWENCQWPRTLATYRALFPECAAVPRTFAMGLEPASRGAAMLSDALSHPLSLLQALLGDEVEVSEIGCTLGPATTNEARAAYDLSFRAQGPAGAVQARVALRHAPEQPRRAWYALDGLRAERTVRLSDYAMQLSDGPRSVALPDPLELHLSAFLRAIAEAPPQAARRGERLASRALSARMAALEALIACAAPKR